MSTITVIPDTSVVSKVSPTFSYDAHDRKNMDFEIFIDGQNIKNTGLHNYLQSIRIERNFPNQDRIDLNFANPDSALLTSMTKFFPGKILSAKVGWKETGLTDIGEYVLTNPKYNFYKSGPGMHLQLTGFDNTMVLTRHGEVQKFWDNVTDSDIAIEIANKYGFAKDIDKTTVKYADGVVQAAQTDLDFLKSRARLHGFLTYVKKNTLHFHPYRVVDNGAKLGYARKGYNITDLNISVVTHRKYAIHKKSQVDPVTLQVHEVSSSNLPDELYKNQSLKYSPFAVVTAGGNSQAQEFVIGEGHLQTEDEIKTQINKFQESSGWSLVKLSGNAHGAEFLIPGELVNINIQDQTRFAGEFLCTSVIHTLSSGDGIHRRGFNTQFELRRSFLGADQKDIDFVKNSILLIIFQMQFISKFLQGTLFFDNKLASGDIAELQPTGNVVTLI